MLGLHMPPDIKNHSYQFMSKDVLFNAKQWVFLKNRYSLTGKELQIAILICQGHNNKEIGRRLKIKPGTVKTHIKNIYVRTGVKNKISLLLKFIEDIREFFPQGKE
jgi:DNA-binding CsgD family transcriptional regulator